MEPPVDDDDTRPRCFAKEFTPNQPRYSRHFHLYLLPVRRASR
jgi:hypothetical protein